ncbi:Syntaxin-binding protein 5-like protein [Zostera marina]|uniref:Syntaxin-binding protein 5-like protein n=1 Tax=Zostera marina TaxID=29655 RepID=A0A0K9Q2H7_ZOSMR|nr:Syntaxin-binding protein 5-like protein [Zostera marina]
MFAKRLLKAIHQPQPRPSANQSSTQGEGSISSDLNLQITLHYGIPLTASILAFDPIQRLLAIGTLDGRIKIIGGASIEGLLFSPKKLPYKYLQFFCNKGLLVGVSNDNDVQIWDLEYRSLIFSLEWESNITSFSIIQGTNLIYVGDDQGSVSVLKYVVEEKIIVRLPYHITLKTLSEAAEIFLPTQLQVVGILPQPFTFGNRLLIAYENGIIVLWDVTEDKVISLKGHSSLHRKGDNATEIEQVDKEICALCWASISGTILAVGYTDGDILLWNLSKNSTKGQQDKQTSQDVVKLQLSSEDRRIPVIILHWSPDIKSDKDCGGSLFVYGGDDIGSEEVLTILSLDWSPGVDSLNRIDRMDLTLNGSFADMVLIPKSGISEISSTDVVFVLTNPGQLHVYEGSKLFNLSQEQVPSFRPKNFPLTVPTIEPCISAAKHYFLPIDENNLKTLLEKASTGKISPQFDLSTGISWPLTGGVPGILSFGKETVFERIYIAGYQDGSVRIWDATSPILTLMYVLDGEVKGVELAGRSSSVLALDFCSTTLTLAVGCESGLVRIYKIHQSPSKESMLHFLNETKHDVDVVPHVDNIHCTAIISLVNSPVQTLHFTHSGSKLAIGYRCGQVKVLDMDTMSLLFNFSDCSAAKSEIISFSSQIIPYTVPNSTKNSSPENSSTKDTKDSAKEIEVLFVLTRDAHVSIVNSITGDIMSSMTLHHPKKESTAISMLVIGTTSTFKTTNQKNSEKLSKDISSDSLLLLCCDNSLSLYSLESVIKGNNDCICEVNLVKPCCWSTVIKLEDNEAYRVILLYRTGTLEMRSLPKLEIIGENSLMSILRWPFKFGMDKTLSSSDNGEISLVYGCEMALLGFSSENNSRIPESLPCLHDKVLAEASEAACSVRLSKHNKKKQDASSTVFDGFIQGLKGGKIEQNENFNEKNSKSSIVQELEKHFSRIPLMFSSSANNPAEKVELDIDDIIIDDLTPVASTSHSAKQLRKDEKNERKQLFEGSTVDSKPRMRTQEEILTQYKFGGDAKAAAAHARDKLVQRQEKLQRMSEKTEELQNRAEDFKSMADELLKTMEKKKFWKF